MAALKLADDAQDYDDASDSGNACAASGSEGLDGGSNSYSNIDSADSDHDGASTTESTQNDAMENKVSDCVSRFHLLLNSLSADIARNDLSTSSLSRLSYGLR